MSAGRRYRNLSRSQITHYVASSPTRPSSFEAYPASPSPRAAADVVPPRAPRELQRTRFRAPAFAAAAT